MIITDIAPHAPRARRPPIRGYAKPHLWELQRNTLTDLLCCNAHVLCIWYFNESILYEFVYNGFDISTCPTPDVYQRCHVLGLIGRKLAVLGPTRAVTACYFHRTKAGAYFTWPLFIFFQDTVISWLPHHGESLFLFPATKAIKPCSSRQNCLCTSTPIAADWHMLPKKITPPSAVPRRLRGGTPFHY